MVVVVVAGSLLGRVVGDCGEVLKNAKLTTLRFQIDALPPLIKFPIFLRLPDLITTPLCLLNVDFQFKNILINQCKFGKIRLIKTD